MPRPGHGAGERRCAPIPRVAHPPALAIASGLAAGVMRGRPPGRPEVIAGSPAGCAGVSTAISTLDSTEIRADDGARSGRGGRPGRPVHGVNDAGAGLPHPLSRAGNVCAGRTAADRVLQLRLARLHLPPGPLDRLPGLAATCRGGAGRVERARCDAKNPKAGMTKARACRPHRRARPDAGTGPDHNATRDSSCRKEASTGSSR